jgi:hypothetical protein
MHRAVGSLETRRMMLGLCKLALSGGALAAVCFWGDRLLAKDWTTHGTAVRLAELSAVISVAGMAFFAVAWLLRVEEMEDLLSVVRRKLKRRAV